MVATYTFSVIGDFSGQIPNIPKLNSEIGSNVIIVTSVNGIIHEDDIVKIFFVSTLNAAEVVALNGVISSHSNTPIVIDTINIENKRLINVALPLQSADGIPFSVMEDVFKPIITTIMPSHLPVSDTSVINITGYNFTPGTIVNIASQTVNSVTFTNPTLISVNVSTIATPGTYNITITNEVGTMTLANAITTLVITWIDLRSGGETLSVGTDIRVRSGMSVVRDVNGMYFTGLNPWSAWVKFERADFQWIRGENRICEWIFTRPTSSMMIGIGSGSTNEASNAQYYQAETLAYFTNATTFWGLFGNSGTPGSAKNQNSTQSIAGGTGVYKVSFTNDGSSGGVFTLYELPDATIGSWDDISTVLKTFTISITPAQSPIFPFIIPRNGGTQRFIAFKVQ